MGLCSGGCNCVINANSPLSVSGQGTVTDPYVLNSSISGGDATTLNGQSGTYYLNRVNHTGTQLASTISNFNAAAIDAVETLIDAKGDLLVGTADNTASRLGVGTDGQVVIASAAAGTGIKWTDATRILGFVLDGGGSAITVGAKKAYVTVPIDCTITKWRLLADIAGSIVLDIWRSTFAGFPPTALDIITPGSKPTLVAAIKNESTTLTGWTTSLTAGDILEINVDSAATVTKVYLHLSVIPR